MEDTSQLVHVDDSAAFNDSTNNNHKDHGWQKVVSKKKRAHPNNNKSGPKSNIINNVVPATAVGSGEDNVFRAIEEKSEDRHRRIVEAQRKSVDEDQAVIKGSDKNKRRSKFDESDDSGSSDAEEKENEVKDDTKVKKKKKAEKKPKVSVAEAAARIDVDNLSAFLVDITGTYGSQEDIQLMRFADYFARAFSSVGSAQFPWVKTFRESPVAKLAEVPISHIPEAVYKTSVDWLNQRSVSALGSFALLLLDSILTDLGSQLPSGKNAKKASRQPSSKSQVAMFVSLAMVLRRKPDVLVSLLPTLRENSKYQGQEKLPVIIWMICQAGQGDLAVGLFAWAHNLLPLLNSKATNNPLNRDLILQLAERILASPKARSILVNGAVRKGERLIPPAELEILMRVTFPPSSGRVKATERFEAVYPTLKEVALAGAPGSKAMKQVSLQIFGFTITAAGERNPELAKEATNIALWCLAQNSDIYKHWDKVYLDNLAASVAILRKLSEEMREKLVSQSSVELMKQTMRSFQQKNEMSEENMAQHSLLKDADKYSKVIMGRLSRGHGCLKAFLFVGIAVAAGAAVVSSNAGNFDWKTFDWKNFDLNRVSVMLSSFQSAYLK